MAEVNVIKSDVIVTIKLNGKEAVHLKQILCASGTIIYDNSHDYSLKEVEETSDALFRALRNALEAA